MVMAISNLVSSSINPASSNKALEKETDFASIVNEPLKTTLATLRHKDHLTDAYSNGEASLSEVAQAVQQAKLDWTALQKVSEKTIQAFNDLIFKTSL